jgi:HEAT repeat protein
MLTHTQPGIRAEAASAAGELEIKSARPLLLELLEDSDIDVRMAAIWALSQVGGKGVRRTLEKLLETTDDDEEADQIDKALENLDFTEEMAELALLEIPEDGDESSEDDYEENADDLISEDELD